MGQGVINSEPETRRFTFAGVELDAATYTLRVDGQPVGCSRKAFELLLQLCLKPERVQTRDELSGALWPGGQIVSDEALTQVIFRARAVLGRYAGLLLTVRGVGLRIDAEVRVVEANAAPPSLANGPIGSAATPIADTEDISSAAAAAVLSDSAAIALPEKLPLRRATDRGLAPAPSQSTRPAAYRWWPLWLTLVVIAVAAIAIRQWSNAQNPLLDEGYGLFEGDLHAQQPGTAAMIRDAFHNDARGERARGQALLQAVHASDASTPVPAIFLALWAAGEGNGETAGTWLARGRERVGTARDVYLNLLLDYVQAEAHGQGTDVIRQAGAILDIRPHAWRMRQARAHLMMAAGMRDAALHELRQIQVRALGHVKLEMVIADRASMGDIRAAQAMLDTLPRGDDVAAYAFLNGRIAWSRGDFDAAHRHFTEAAVKGFESARSDLQRRALVNMAAIEVMRDRDDAAIEALERARVGSGASGRLIDEIDTSLFLAELHARAGRAAQAQTELEHALRTSEHTIASSLRLIAGLVALRLHPEVEMPAPTEDRPAGVEALWRGRLAFNRGDLAAARQALTDARHRGVFDGKLVDEARFLAAQLGLPVPNERPVDPPYPPMSQFVVRRDVRLLLAAPKP